MVWGPLKHLCHGTCHASDVPRYTGDMLVVLHDRRQVHELPALRLVVREHQRRWRTCAAWTGSCASKAWRS
jgi:hypothetical protein